MQAINTLIFIYKKGCKLGSLMRLKRESNEAGI